MMNKKKTTQKMMSQALATMATLSMVAACSSDPVAPVQPSPQPTPTPAVSGNPTPTPTPNESVSPAPVETPAPGETAEPGETPAPGESAEPIPSATPDNNDTSVIERTTFNGKIYDDSNAPLSDVIVKARSLDATVVYEQETRTAGGTYAFNNVPSGVQIEITASRPGYTTRRRVEVLKSNKTGDPNANRYDFGTDGSGTLFGVAYNALSDKPEVVSVTPARNSAGIAANTNFVLKFSEPMDRKTVLDNIQIRSFTEESLSVDDDKTFDPGTLNEQSTGTVIWDKAAFNASWNSEDTEVTLSFKEERMLPTDKDSDKVPDYQVSFQRQDQQLKDKSGITRSENYFKLTDGNFEQSYKFSIQSDTQKPTLESLTAQTAENSGVNSNGDAIKLRYSERMIHYTLNPTIAGGMNGVASQAAGAISDEGNSVSGEAAAANYRVTVIRSGNTELSQANWSALGGRAIFDTSDPTHKTILLLPPMASASSINAQGSIAPTDSIMGTIYYTDGSTQAIDVAAGGTGYANVESALNGLLKDNPFDLTELSNGNGTVDNGDSYRLILADGARNLADTKDVSNIRIENSGAFANDKLNAALNLFPGVAAGARADIYRPGDNIIVMANTTILDPAGNSVDSSGDDVSANAS